MGRLLFYYTTTTGTFQREMNSVYGDLFASACVVSSDDVLVIQSTFRKHSANLVKAVESLCKVGFRLSNDNYHFALTSVQ